jgi:hypothetical protein
MTTQSMEITGDAGAKNPAACGSSYIEWSAIIAGAVTASAISLVLMQFGNAIGLAATSPFHADRQLTTGGLVAIGIWILWIQVSASMAGGYLAGRMRAPLGAAADHEREIRDGMHGMLVWATGTVAVAVTAAAGAAMVAMIAGHNGQPIPAVDMTVVQHNTAIIFAFCAAAVSFVAAVATWWAATMGGEHRDKAVDHSAYVSFRRK